MISEQIRVLIIDDEDSFRTPLQKFLQNNYDYKVETFANGLDAMLRIEQPDSQFDVALIDQSLIEGPNGIKVAREIKLQHPDIETIILTGWDMDDTKQAMEAAVFRYLKKSQTDPDEIALLVRGAAQNARLHAISRSILSANDLERLIETIAAAARSLTAADDISVILRNPGGKGMRIYPKTDAIYTEWKRHFHNEQLSSRIIQTGHPIQVLDTQQDERVAPELISSGIRAFVGSPIPGRKGNLGVLYAYRRSTEGFDAWGTLTVLQTLAAQAGLAIANTQALKDEQKRTNEFQELYDLGTDLSSSLDLEDVLERVAAAACQLTGAERATVSVRIGNESSYYFVQRGATKDPSQYPPILVEPSPNGLTMTHIFGQGQPFLLPEWTQETPTHPALLQ